MAGFVRAAQAVVPKQVNGNGRVQPLHLSYRPVARFSKKIYDMRSNAFMLEVLYMHLLCDLVKAAVQACGSCLEVFCALALAMDVCFWGVAQNMDIRMCFLLVQDLILVMHSRTAVRLIECRTCKLAKSL